MWQLARPGKYPVLEQSAFPSCHIPIAGISILETNQIGQGDPGRVEIPCRVQERHLWGFCVSRPVGWSGIGPDREVLSSLGVARTAWLHKSSVIRVGGDDVGGTAPEENGNQQFLGGIVDLAEIRVISSGLDSAVPAEILGSARWASLVYHPPQTACGRGRAGARRRGDCARCVCAVAGLCS